MSPRSRWPSCRFCPPCRSADQTTLVVADGTSCRHQIKDGTEREALHVARVLAMSLDNAKPD
jgi:Fe-S oxidoreductase